MADCVKAMRGAVRRCPSPSSIASELDYETRSYGFVVTSRHGCAERGQQGIHRPRTKRGARRACRRRTIAKCRGCATTSCTALKREFPALTIVLNGGITTWQAIERELAAVDGVMLGRTAYHDPMVLAPVDWRLFGGTRRRSHAREAYCARWCPTSTPSARAACRCVRSRATCWGSTTGCRAAAASGSSCRMPRGCRTRPGAAAGGAGSRRARARRGGLAASRQGRLSAVDFAKAVRWRICARTTPGPRPRGDDDGRAALAVARHRLRFFRCRPAGRAAPDGVGLSPGSGSASTAPPGIARRNRSGAMSIMIVAAV